MPPNGIKESEVNDGGGHVTYFFVRRVKVVRAEFADAAFYKSAVTVNYSAEFPNTSAIFDNRNVGDNRSALDNSKIKLLVDETTFFEKIFRGVLVVKPVYVRHR